MNDQAAEVPERGGTVDAVTDGEGSAEGAPAGEPFVEDTVGDPMEVGQPDQPDQPGQLDTGSTGLAGGAAPETGDLVIDAALRELAEAPQDDLDAQIERGEQVQRTLQGRLGDLGG